MLAEVQATFPALDRWHDALTVLYRPNPGTDLALDDAAWPYMPTSQLAIMGLGSARDHLQAVRVHLEAGETFPYAQSTLIRGALVGAAQAAWVLSPSERQVRVERSWCIAAEIYSQHLKYLRTLDLADPNPHAVRSELIARVSERELQLADLRSTAGSARQLQATGMIVEAARAAFPNERATHLVESYWRKTSGSAHGLSWALFGGPDTTQVAPTDEGGLAGFSAGGGIDRIADEYLIAYRLALTAWGWLRLRGNHPVEGSPSDPSETP